VSRETWHKLKRMTPDDRRNSFRALPMAERMKFLDWHFQQQAGVEAFCDRLLKPRVVNEEPVEVRS